MISNSTLPIYSKPLLPIEMEFIPNGAKEYDEPDYEAFTDKMVGIKKDIHQQVHENIRKAQIQQKENHDRKHVSTVVSAEWL